MSNIRNIIIFIGLAAIFTSIYIFFIKKGPESNLNIASSSVNSFTQNSTPGLADSSQNVVAQNFLSLLLNTKKIKLEDSIFSDKSFQSLIDSSIVLIPDINAGRINPFAQLGSDASAVTPNTPSGSNVPTVVPGSTTTPIVPPTTPVVPPTTPANTAPNPTIPGAVKP